MLSGDPLVAQPARFAQLMGRRAADGIERARPRDVGHEFQQDPAIRRGADVFAETPPAEIPDLPEDRVGAVETGNLFGQKLLCLRVRNVAPVEFRILRVERLQYSATMRRPMNSRMKSFLLLYQSSVVWRTARPICSEDSFLPLYQSSILSAARQTAGL